MRTGVLIVDDQDDVRLLLEMLIEAANEGLFVSGSAADGREALEHVAALDPGVIVLDEMMPDMTGLELAKEVRRMRPNQIIILCSAYLDSTLSGKAQAAGVRSCVHKDDIATIPGVVRELLGVAG